MIKLVILDFDGTLADTVELIVKTNQEVQRRMNYPVCAPETIIATIGLPLAQGIEAMYPEEKLEDLPQWVKVYRKVFDELKTQIVPALFPHVQETLAELTARGCVCTVASSRGRESLNDFLREMGLSQYISYVLGAEDVTRAKPYPDPVLKTLEKLDISASEAIVVGDMPVDIQMGLGAGAYTCGVTYGNSGRESLEASGAHYVIDDFQDLLQFLPGQPR